MEKNIDFLSDEELFEGELKAFRLIMMEINGQPVNKSRINWAGHVSSKADKRRLKNTAEAAVLSTNIKNYAIDKNEIRKLLENNGLITISSTKQLKK